MLFKLFRNLRLANIAAYSFPTYAAGAVTANKKAFLFKKSISVLLLPQGDQMSLRNNGQKIVARSNFC
jgi:hypothetical protein